MRRDIIKEKILKYKIPIIILLALLILIIASILSTKTNSEEEVVIEKETKITKKENKTSKIKVDIKGEVVNAGVYDLKKGSRVIDLIEKAGGLTQNADTELINLSKKLDDENIVIIYSKQQVQTIKENSKQNNNTSLVCECPETNDACISEDNVIANTIEKDNKSTSKDGETKTTQGKININTASKTELETLNGIGETRAQAIIDYRNKNGNFGAIEDIKNVQGIGTALYEKIKDNITV